MSQQQVGGVYSKIIDEVCDSSQIDFEEGGVHSETLQLLKKRWQEKLSALEVGHFPWEPQPQVSTTTAGSGSTPTPQSTPNISPHPSKPQQQHIASENARPPPIPPPNQGPRIKGEGGQYQPPGPFPMTHPMPQISQHHTGAMNAPQRAAQALQQQFGPRAASQISQLQQSNGPRQQLGLANSQFQGTEDRKSALPSFSAPGPQSRTPLQSAQHDGGRESLAEWKAEVARRRALAEVPSQGDRLFHEHMLQRQQQLEGGGLMIPLDEHYIQSAGTKRRIEALFGSDGEQQVHRPPPSQSSLSKAQGDAHGDDDDDDDDLDEDAINSDLDDPEDNGNHLEDENVEQVMLCTYDKVQRVKNKWKCTLKDGILRVANKEYVFHKGQGEFEW